MGTRRTRFRGFPAPGAADQPSEGSARGPVPIRGPAGRPQPSARLPAHLRGLLLDTCNVLYDETVWRRWLLQLLSRLGLHTNYRCFFRVWDRDFLDEVHRGRRDFREAFEAFLLSVGLTRGQIDEVGAACPARRRDLETDARPLPGVKTTLARLREAGFVLGAIANSEHAATVLQQRLNRLGVGRFFSALVSSIDLGRTMPDPLCYRAALQALQLPARQVAFVGHDAAELAGAAAVGMPTAAFNFDPEAQADVHLGRFEELLEVIDARPPFAAAG